MPYRSCINNLYCKTGILKICDLHKMELAKYWYMFKLHQNLKLKNTKVDNITLNFTIQH